MLQSSVQMSVPLLVSAEDRTNVARCCATEGVHNSMSLLDLPSKSPHCLTSPLPPRPPAIQPLRCPRGVFVVWNLVCQLQHCHPVPVPVPPSAVSWLASVQPAVKNGTNLVHTLLFGSHLAFCIQVQVQAFLLIDAGHTFLPGSACGKGDPPNRIGGGEPPLSRSHVNQVFPPGPVFRNSNTLGSFTRPLDWGCFSHRKGWELFGHPAGRVVTGFLAPTEGGRMPFQRGDTRYSRGYIAIRLLPALGIATGLG